MMNSIYIFTSKLNQIEGFSFLINQTCDNVKYEIIHHIKITWTELFRH